MIFFLVSYYQTNYVADVPIVPQSLVGMPTYLPGQVDALHPFRMHQQAVTHSGLKVAVASSADRIMVDANLAASGLQLSMFDAIVSADAFENLKPAPDIFLAASKILDLPTDEKGGRCLVQYLDYQPSSYLTWQNLWFDLSF
ncbi:hypothetical protein POM88_034596 [Heracleum sosnowskyi]|uniref:Uncharacterized protein n=1 Tax=Heracleum sosnowskyi TaxID=360622 RepID=A0AAD8HLH9_9APIA|nr:hypothetical protein POM88_034596 [Heracleum sosnowskyi]